MAKVDLKSGLANALGNVSQRNSSTTNQKVNMPLGFQVDREHLQKLKRIAESENRDLKEVINEALAFYLEFQVDIIGDSEEA